MNNRFATTRWSLVLAAGKGASADAQQALAALCQTYWYPLYAYVRRQGHQPDDAQDLTQEFFARLLEKHYLQGADPGLGVRGRLGASSPRGGRFDRRGSRGPRPLAPDRH